MAVDLLATSEQLQRIKFYFDLLQQTAEGYPFVTDLTTGVVLLSSRMVEEYGLPGTVVVDFDRYWTPLVYPEDMETYEASFAHIFEPGNPGVHDIEYRVRNREGVYTWIHCHGMVGRDDSGDAVIFAGFITEMDRILHADPVTGLLNRFAFDQAVKEGVTCSQEDIEKFCLELPRYKRPRKIIFDTVPRNATGKIEKPVLRKRYNSENLVAKETQR